VPLRPAAPGIHGPRTCGHGGRGINHLMPDGTVAVGTERADRVADALPERDADMLLVTDVHNVRWLTGFTGSSGAAVVGREGERRFVTDFRYLTQSAEELDPAWEREIAVDLLAGLVKRLPGAGDLRLAFDDAHLSVKDHGKLAGMLREGIELVPASGVVEALRAVKDDSELDAIRAAARLADDALTEVLGRGLVGRTEREVALDLEFTMRRMGAEAASFPPIVAAADHGALPHATPREVAIPSGTLCVVDWGAQLDGYASDCTRTYATGEVDPRDAEVYALVLRAQEAGLAAVRRGPTGREVDAVARAIIDSAGHAEHFGHGLGHGVGLDVHEGPRLSKQGDTALEAGMVVTIEPGVYVPGAIGVRIEDLVIVTDDGAEVVSSLPKDLQVVA
jgi:Xaa-Pro aminopeptidase